MLHDLDLTYVLLLAPIPATQKVLKKAGLSINEIDIYEGMWLYVFMLSSTRRS